ncbi:MAG: YkgJ family cysteine cluster protein [Fimbriimonas ginsengisoli]|uniref:YkgJ family cysteine cluster protein n=1 Tax=Fimbriimonas ginsengisoli TaxID=1005039 RepID=A0A931M133_FIMGI|nr:YkgJ family cysteine cluster protein [Fimbriimonas ginsengisoli]
MPDRLQSLVNLARDSVAGAIQTGDPSRLIRVTQRLYTAADREMDKIHAQATTPLACHKGCDSCCHRVVSATFPEIHLIAEFVRDNFTEAEREAVKARTEGLRKANEGFWSLRDNHPSGACPFLVEGACSVYSVRPISCRALNSTSVESCRNYYLEGKGVPEGVLEEQATLTQMNLPVVNLTRDAGLRSGLYELGPAVLELLTNPDQPDLEPLKMLSEWTHENPAMNPPVEALHRDPAKQSILDLREAGDAGEVWRRLDRFRGTPFEAIFRHSIPGEFRTEEELDLWWRRWDEALTTFEGAKLPSAETFELLQDFNSFSLAYLGRNVKPYLQRFMSAAHRHAARAYPHLTAPIENARRPGKRRLGFISYRIKNFNGSRWALGWLMNLSPDIETYVINLTEVEDHTSRCFRRHADHYLHLPFTVAEAAPIVRALDLDALIFTDIGMDGHTTQLATLRLARRQYAAWGHPVTSGSPTMDYYLASDLMEPANGDEHYMEKLVRLPGTGVTYQKRLLTPSTKTPAELGVPEGGYLLFCQLPLKQTPVYDFLLEEIAARSEKRLVFLSASPSGRASLLQERIAKRCSNVLFLPRQPMPDYLRILQLADASLDCPAWSGGVTTIDAITMGTPTVTLPGEFMRGRMSLAFLTQAGAPGLVAKDAADYIELALDEDRRREAMRGLNVDALYDDTSSAQAISEHVLGAPE